MIFQKSNDNDITIVTVKLKRATMSEAGELKTLLNDEIDKGNNQIIIDMNECEYIDSTFLGVLVTTFKKAGEAGGDIKLVGFKNTAQAVIDITGTSRIFKIYPSVKQAISSFKSAA